MFKDEDELSYEPSLLVAEAMYWDLFEEQDDGIPRSYRNGTLKVQRRDFESE